MLIETQVVDDAIKSIADVSEILNNNMNFHRHELFTSDIENLLGYIFLLENELKKVVNPNQPLT